MIPYYLTFEQESGRDKIFKVFEEMKILKNKNIGNLFVMK